MEILPGDDTRLLSNDLPSMFPNQNNKVKITAWVQPTSLVIPPFKFESTVGARLRT